MSRLPKEARDFSRKENHKPMIEETSSNLSATYAHPRLAEVNAFHDVFGSGVGADLFGVVWGDGCSSNATSNRPAGL